MSENRLDKFKTALNGVKVPILVLDKKWYILRQKAGTINEINALEKELKELLKRQGKLTNDLNSLKKIKKDLPSDEIIFDMAEIFKVFGDSTRMKIISALLEDELCVGDIAIITNSTPSAISHQLRVLKQSKLVKFRKEGKIVYYSLADEHVSEIYEKGREHVEEV